MNLASNCMKIEEYVNNAARERIDFAKKEKCHKIFKS